MVLRLDLSPEAESRLRERAAAAGKEVDRFVLEAVEAKLSTESATEPSDLVSARREESPEEWIKRFDAWVNSHPRRGYIADDSRESIYAGRGE